MWQDTKDLWNNGQRIRAIMHFLNRLPNALYPGTYDSIEDHDVSSLIFWWRELFHFVGGAIIGFSFFFLNMWIVVCAVLILISAKELYDSVDEGFGFKNFVDAAVWGLGAFIAQGVVHGTFWK